MNRQPVSLKVLAAYARDIGKGIVRIDHNSMDLLGVHTGDTVEVIGKREGIDAKCYPLLPSDENQGIARIDPHLRKAIGAQPEDMVMIRNLTPVPAENFEESEPAAGQTGVSDETAQEDIASEIVDPVSEVSTQVFILSGSCTDFDKERPKLMEFMTTLESAARSKSKSKCYSDGKKALGWEFFMLEVDQHFVERLRDLYPDMDKQEAGTIEERFALWMNKQLKKTRLDFHLKLSEVPQEKVGGFRLNPEHFRDRGNVEDLR